jgi:hypothetical protein
MLVGLGTLAKASGLVHRQGLIESTDHCLRQIRNPSVALPFIALPVLLGPDPPVQDDLGRLDVPT